jgi:threonine dehydratase
MSATASLDAPDLDDIRAAAERIGTYAIRTPLLESERLNERVGARVLVKAEVLQRTGSFKFRGAKNFLRQIPESQRARGVVAFSSGNHAQAVAEAARLHQIRATLVMPADAPKTKIEVTRALGGEVILYDRKTQSREALATSFQEKTGATLVPPFDHPWTIAGQGTVGLELAEQAKALGVELDAVLVPCSGGGLVAGCATALHALSPITKVYAVEPSVADDTRRSLAAGHRVTNEGAAPATLCDALLVETPGALTFAINQRRLAGGLTVTDDEVLEAMSVAFRDLKLVAEPSGAAGLAAALAGKVPTQARSIGIVLSGGNMDSAIFARALAAR